MAENKTVGVGLVGAGLIGALHSFCLRAVRERTDFKPRLVHVADREFEKAKRFQELFGWERGSGEAEAVLDDDEVEAVYICTWTSEHRGLVEAAADRGKHVFCEKPLAFNAEEAEAMLEAVRRAGVVHQVGLVLRQAPVWNALRDLVRNPENGFPVTVIFRDDQCFPIKGAHPSEWRKDKTRAGRGTLLEHSIHDLDLLEWMFGRVERVRASAASRFGHPGIEDLARVEIEFASGMTGTLVSVWHDVLNRHSNRRMEVFHEKVFHAVESEFTGPILEMRGEGLMKTIPEPEVNRRFWELRKIEDPELRNLSLMFGAWADYLFVKSAAERARLGPGFEVALRAHVLVDACYRSAAEGVPVKVPPPREPASEDQGQESIAVQGGEG